MLWQENQHAAEGRAAEMEAKLAGLRQQIAALQVPQNQYPALCNAGCACVKKVHWLQVAAEAAAAEVQTQKDVNAQLMIRKQDIEWQLMTALAGKKGHEGIMEAASQPIFQITSGQDIIPE